MEDGSALRNGVLSRPDQVLQGGPSSPVPKPAFNTVHHGDRSVHRVRVVFVAIAVLIVAFGAVAGYSLSTIRSHTTEIATNSLPSLRIIEDTRNHAQTHRTLLLSHAIADEMTRLDSIEAAMSRVGSAVDRGFEQYRPLVSSSRDAKLLRSASDLWQLYLTNSSRVLAPSRSDDFDLVRALVEADVNPAFDRLSRELDRWVELNVEAAGAELDQTDDAFQEAVLTIFVSLVLALGALAGGARLAVRSIRAGQKSTSELLGAALRDAQQAGVFQRLADRLTFASDEDELATAAQATVARLVESDRGDLLLLNPSRDRLTVGMAWGAEAPERGLQVGSKPDRCPGIRRGSLYQATDLTDDLEVHCQAHPAAAGSLLCVPMIALGQTVGVIHLERSSPFREEELRLAVRTSEQVSVALANARLLRTMESLAMTDALTGLHNARFFDPAMDLEVAAAARERRPVAVLMIDLDKFKNLNDTHGHQAGDQALRSFGATLRATLRESDLAARYGGEEFVVLLRDTDSQTAVGVAEKLRVAVEHTEIEIAPGREIRMTASVGVATTEQAGLDRMNLLRLADAALYRAKQSGRNRVQLADPQVDAPPALEDAEDPGETTRAHSLSSPEQAQPHSAEVR